MLSTDWNSVEKPNESPIWRHRIICSTHYV